MSNARSLNYGALAGVIVVYLVIIQGLGVALSQGTDADYATFPDVETTLRAMTVPVAVSVLFAIAVISVLRQWSQVIHENNPTQPWVWVVPIVLVAASFGVMDYENLGRIDSSLLITVVASSLLVGIGEELMFRGVTIQALRDNGMAEHRVALWSSIIFGLAHITNLISEGSGAILQVIVVSISGFFFYLSYRVAGTIVVPILLHALWDFSLFSHNVGEVDPSPNARQSLPLLANILLVIILYVRRDKIDPAPEPSAVPA
ncbi:MAG: CPBP family intramembrane glutamic endopeptidase [Acidimicrobiia bacterium]